VSPQSPLGESLLGAKPGDTVSYHAPTGDLRVVVISVE
jgi:transcription elongation GreA/GreB family factor